MEHAVGEPGHRKPPNVLVSLRDEGETPISGHMLQLSWKESRLGQHALDKGRRGSRTTVFDLCHQNGLWSLKDTRRMPSQEGWPGSAKKGTGVWFNASFP